MTSIGKPHRWDKVFSFPWIFGGSFLAACDGGELILHLTAAGVDLNNECHWTTDGGPRRAEGPLASGPAVRVYLVMLLVFLASLEPANTLLHYLTRTRFRHECVKTAERWNTFSGLLRRGSEATARRAAALHGNDRVKESTGRGNNAWKGRSSVTPRQDLLQ